MTRQELDESFEVFRTDLEKYLRKRWGHNLKDGVEGVVMDTYIQAVEKGLYESVKPEHAKSWWIYKIRSTARTAGGQQRKEDEAAGVFYDNIETLVDQDLTEERAQHIAEGYWSGLPRYTKTRMRQRWQEEGRPLLPFMEKKKRV